MYKRVLLKLSGEALAGENKTGVDDNVMNSISDAIKEIHNMDIEIGIVVGGGNFWRGKYAPNMIKTYSDYMGMLATVMNSLAIQDALEKRGIDTVVETSFRIDKIGEAFDQRNTMKYLNEKKVIIFAGGTGSPFFSTDTAAALRATEIGADVILVAKTVDGVYSDDPKINSNAFKYDHITYKEVLEKDLKVFDLTAISLCKENNIPLLLFAMNDPQNIIKAINEENIGTKID